MDKMWTFYLSIILLSVKQIQHVLATGCNIQSVTSPSASSLDVVWSSTTDATSYELILKVVNSTTVAPVVLKATQSETHRLVRGLRPGHIYDVTLIAFQHYTKLCTDVERTITVPAISQITFSKAISSTSIRFEWSSVIGADNYILFVETVFSTPAVKYNNTFTTLGGQVDDLTPSTTYNCYVQSSNSAGRGAKSNIKTIRTLVQPPTGVSIAKTGKSTARVTWDAVSKVLLYQVAVHDTDLSNPPVFRNTSATTMDIGGLEPCSVYTVGVSSLNGFLEPGEAANVSYTTATINPVTTTSVDYSCSTGMVTVTWDLVFGANMYRATAIDGTGASLNCTSPSTSCQITMLVCGEKYNVHVTAISDDCESTSNFTTLFETVPCAPANPEAEHECSSNGIIFRWQPTNNTLYYEATALDNTGKKVHCRTVDNFCYFTNVGCGQYYTYTVFAVSSECNSEPSAPEFVRTSPCLPTNIRTSADCLPNELITTWDAVAGALSYTVEVQGNTRETLNCTTSTTSCAVTGVPCGEHLSVWIIASNDNCSTDKVLGETAQTVPCTPSTVSVAAECSQDSAKVNWTASIGSVFYVATAEDTDGNSHSCNTFGTNCLIEGLRCGQNYTASVIGTNLKCNSTISEQVTFMTGPCPPTNIDPIRDCDANHALIIWQNHKPTGLYTAVIEDQSGDRLNCTSNTVNNCKITSLPCGKRYNVTVSYSDGNCVSTSTSVSMDSVPCSLENVTASVACVTGELTVTWDNSVHADNYTAIITGGTGQHLYCNSTETQCTREGLVCGSSYMVNVFSVTGTCLSRPGTEITVKALSCPPTNITTQHACSPDPVPVSWVASQSAQYYTAVAVSSGGHRSECTTNQVTCSLPGLQCGEVYTIGVSGAADNCSGPQGDTVLFNTEPCSPYNVSSQLFCSAGIAQVSWPPMANAIKYGMKATSNGQTFACNSTSPNCTLNNLMCGHPYNIAVTATDGTCVSRYSAPYIQDEVPCPPSNVTTNLVCGTNDLTVSWDSSAASLNYSAIAVPWDGSISSVTCSTTLASCTLSGLQCGQIYNVSVKACSGSCCGPYSRTKAVQTAPCSPQSLTAVVECGTGSLLASWNASLGATSYTATVTGPNGFSKQCSSSYLNCSISGLQCAIQYNITVISRDSSCTSAPIQTVMTTGPCDPVNVTSVLHCGSDTATVSWAAAAGAVSYTVLAQEDSSQHYTSCRSGTTSCQLEQLQCGKVYNLTVMAEDSSCNSTGGISATLMTAPCAPSIQTTTLICGTNATSVSWLPMASVIKYIVNATATNGHTVTCSSATATCTLTDLQCSEIYMTTIIAAGSKCDSARSTTTNITTSPCSPAIVSKQYTCQTNKATFSWTDPMGSLSFLAQVTGQGYQESCQTTNTSCAVQNIPCGLDLILTVQAQGAQCNSTSSASESLETVPCAPKNVSASLVCASHSVLVSWVQSPNAIRYNVTLRSDKDGHMHDCQTNTTNCQLNDIHCGETYHITVTPYSETCAGHPSASYVFRTGLCAPSNVTVSPACEDSIVSWSNVAGAEMFIATATVDDHNHTCSSNYSNSCNFTDLHCGENYTVTVVTVDRGCQSEPSSAVLLRTALCPATNLAGQANCDANTLTLTWDQSPTSGVTYSLQTERTGSGHSPTDYTTPNTSYTLTNLLCGERYTFRIAAQDGACRSSYSTPIEISTVPCQPTNFTVHVECGLNQGNFSWADTSEAGFYTVEVTGEHGHVASCSSNDTSCAVKLHCGRTYSATLVASTESCNSSKHADIHFDSAPCLPDDVFADVQCNTNVMNVTWTQTTGSDDYSAWAISTDGHRTSCNTSTSNSCSINTLQCGKVYSVAVTSSSIHCEIIAGSDYKVQSAPCKPENISVDQNCSSNAMTVRWNQRSTNQNYTVKATSASGVNSTCDSSESSCCFLDLTCGQLYTFTVMGYTNVCISEMSTPVDKLTAPCPPTSVAATINCTTHNALVSWSSAAAATGYSVQATSSNGHNSSCSEMGTSCYLNNLVCGQEYSVVVEAIHTGCPGPASAPTTLVTEPCAPTNLTVHYNVSTAQVMWGAASGANAYSVQAVTDQGSTNTCNTTNTKCFLNGLQCSHIYNVTVLAHNQACDSVISETYCLKTEPCPPTNVQASMGCEQLTATVSWQQSNLTVGYVAYFDDQNGHEASCVATDMDTQCVVSGLTCGTVYNVWVKALGQQYNSSASTVTTLTTEPCQVSNIKAVMDCEADSATISWQPSVGAVSYVSELTSSSGHTTSCTTNHTNCELSSLQCGQEYNVSVTAVGKTCNSTVQMAGHLTTEPCVPTNLSVHYNMSTAQVMWGAAKGASSYSVQAVTDQGSTVTCNTTNTNCFLNGLQCSHIYNVTVMAQNMACNNTVTSEPYCLKTEPCPPTNVQASMACEQLTATVSWQQSNLAVGYLAYLDNQNGHEASCVATDTDTSCVVSGLTCGTVYNVWVKALGQQYNSSASTVITLTSAPCLPTEIEVYVDCNSDGAAVVSWDSTYGTANFSLTAPVSGVIQTLCATQHNGCNVTGLTCGDTYNLSLTVSNTQCSLTVPMHPNLTTRPCPPQDVAVELQCGSRTAVLSWKEKSDVELYKARAIKASGGEVLKCNTTGSTCQFSSLDCGETYNFTVTAYSQECSSQASSTVFIQTEPCQPVIVSAQAPCDSADVQISWQQASGVVNYLVTAKGNLGYVETYNITQTLLSAALPCGQDYNVTVRGQGSECDSIPSSPAFFKTTPCIPRDVKTYVQCELNVGSVSWGPSDGAKTYVAVATGLDNHTHICPTNATSCTWNDLHCGEQYTVVVRAKDGNCTSLPSNSTVIHMDPCVPQNLSPAVNCDMKVVSLSWDACNGTNSYIVSAVAGNKTIKVTTNDPTANFSDLTCGQNYSLTVAPQSQHCPGISSAPAFIQTWPCPPVGVSTKQNCLSGVVTVSWQASNGSEYYAATAQSEAGLSFTCSSESNSCDMHGLTCGHNFSVSVTAMNEQCNTTSEETTSLQSVPCVPTNVLVAVNCTDNTAVVSWSASRGAAQYAVTAHSNHGNVSCQTSGLSCSLDALTCGTTYSVQVVAMDDTCSSIPSQAVTFNSAACPPHNVSAEVSCLSNDMTISWDAVREADHFLVSVIADNGGFSETLNTTNTAASISNVSCGKTFSVQVTSVKGSCSSQHSHTLSALSAPCQPQGISGRIDCVTNSAWISWNASAGADSYTVSAVGGENHMANCTTSTNTTCEVEDLECGVLYNFTVTAQNSRCESQPSVTIQLQTAPCSLAGITAVPQCHNSSILVTWDLMDGGEGNIVYVTAEARDHTYLSCNSTGTSCYLYGAQCDFQYSIIVAASSDQCNSMRSPPVRISMEPCPPTNLVVNASCEDNSALVSWSPSPVAETYHVFAMAADGHVHTCNTTSSNCSILDLHCDERYTVFVRASHENCTSKPSQNVTVNTGPCQPVGLSVTYHCDNQSALLLWTPSDNTVDYYGCAQAANGDMLYCHSTVSTCTIQGLDCGTAYNFSVQASDGTCNSSFSDPVQSSAVPCPPDTFEVRLLPVPMDVQVLRFSWTQVPCNNTEYLLRLTGTLLGDSLSQFDVSSYWTSVTYFEMPLPCGSNYSATVTSRNAAGTSDPTAPLLGTTAPCPPTGAVYNSSSGKITWSPSVFATSYKVYNNSVMPKVVVCTTTALSCSLSNIYSTDLVITANNAAGESDPANITIVSMGTQDRRRRDVGEKMPDSGELGGLVAPMLNVTQVLPTVTLAEWSQVDAASHYSLIIKQQGGSSRPQELIVYGDSTILTDLSPNTIYCLTVSAMDEDTSGPESEPVCVQTGQ